MNPNNKAWQKLCLNTIRYFQDMGFDYIQLDQIAYQRNLFLMLLLGQLLDPFSGYVRVSQMCSILIYV